MLVVPGVIARRMVASVTRVSIRGAMAVWMSGVEIGRLFRSRATFGAILVRVNAAGRVVIMRVIIRRMDWRSHGRFIVEGSGESSGQRRV